MYSGDEFYGDEITSPDPLAMADFRRDELKHTSSCPSCGSREPARIEGRTCSDCTEYPRCPICQRWIGEGFRPPVVVTLDGMRESVCEDCFMRQSPSLPLDYREVG